MKAILIKFILLFAIMLFSKSLFAQCSEAENTTMKKYADLTRNSSNVQSCSMCAWLANLYCIAENGLYENDKAGVEKAINETKANIKLMGDPICCPELVSKNAIWGTLNSKGTPSSNNSSTSAEIEEAVQKGLNQIDNLIQTSENSQNYALAKDKIDQNAKLKGYGYKSEQEIEDEYQRNLANINNVSSMFINSRVEGSQLSVERGKMSNDATIATASSIFGDLEVEFARQEAEKTLEAKKLSLLYQKQYLIAQFRVLETLKNGNITFIKKEDLEKVLDRKGDDYTMFLNHAYFKQWNPSLKINKFNKVADSLGYPKVYGYSKTYMGLYGAYDLYELKNSPQYRALRQSLGLSSFKAGYNFFSPYRCRVYIKNDPQSPPLTIGYDKKRKTIVQVVQTTITESTAFDLNTFAEFQDKIIKAIEEKSKLFNIPAEKYNVNISSLDPSPTSAPSTFFQIVVTVVWTDKHQMAYAMVGVISIKQLCATIVENGKRDFTSCIKLEIKEGNLSLASKAVLKDFDAFPNYNLNSQLINGN